jgi:type II secretory pathway component GspD/PulD (secretin)
VSWLLSAALWCASATVAPPPGLVSQRLSLQTMSVEQALLVHDRVLGTAPGAKITGSPKGDAVILHDERPRIDRFRTLLTMLDLPGAKGRRIFVRPVQHRLASELVTVTRRVFGEAMGRDVGFAPDDRSSRLVVRASAAQYRTIDRLLKRLDIRPRDERRIFILPGRTSLPLPGQ